MTGRLIHVSSTGAGISNATIYLIFAIVAIIGYFVLERGNDRKPPNPPASTHQSPIPSQSNTTSNPPPPPGVDAPAPASARPPKSKSDRPESSLASQIFKSYRGSEYKPLRDQINIVEKMFKEDWSLAKHTESAELRKVMADTWDRNSRWGFLPTVMFEICGEIVRSGAIDFAVMVEMMREDPKVWESKISPAKDIVTRGFDMVNGKRVVKDSYAPVELLLGWFALPYRGYQGAEWEISEKGSDSIGDGAKLLHWLIRAGQKFLTTRLLTSGGADLLDCSMRVSFTRIDPTSDQYWKMDITLFISETPDEDVQWMSLASDEEKSNIWLIIAVNLTYGLTRKWIHRTYPGDEKGRTSIRRLFVRPGYANKNISGEGYTRINGQALLSDKRPPIEMDLSNEAMQSAIEKDEMRLMRFNHHLVKSMKITTIKFINRRQNEWYIPSPPPRDNFDKRQIEFIFGLLKTELRRGRTELHMDFGGMMLFAAKEWGQIQHTFPWSGRNTEGKIFYIPFIPSRPQLADTAEWLVTEGLGIFVAIKEKRATFAIVMKSLDQDALCSMIDSAIMNRVHQYFGLGGTSRESVREEMTELVKVMNLIKLTTIDECGTEHVRPTLHDFTYASYPKEKVERLMSRLPAIKIKNRKELDSQPLGLHKIKPPTPYEYSRLHWAAPEDRERVIQSIVQSRVFAKDKHGNDKARDEWTEALRSETRRVSYEVNDEIRGNYAQDRRGDFRWG